MGAGTQNPSFFAVLENAVVGPIAAFFTFIGSMGNIPLAAILFNNGVSFAGVMAFIFSDLVVFPVIRVNAKYYGWKVALYIVGVFFAALVATAITMHYAFSLFGILPQSAAGSSPQSTERFAIDYTFWLNLAFLAATGVLAWLRFGSDKKQSQQNKHHDHQKHKNHDKSDRQHHGGHNSGGGKPENQKKGDGGHNHGGGKQGFTEKLLFWLAMLSYVWLIGGIIVTFFVSSSGQ